MKSAVKMMLWEFWVRNRRTNIGALLVLPAWASCWAFLPHQISSDDHILASTSYNLFLSLVLFLGAMYYFASPVLITSYAGEQIALRRPSYPERFCTLPLPTWLLVLVPTATLVMLLAAFCALFSLINPGFRQHAWWWSFLILTAEIWTLGTLWRFFLRPLHVLTLYAVIATLAAAAGAPFDENPWPVVDPLLLTLPPLLLILGLRFVYRSVQMVRTGSTPFMLPALPADYRATPDYFSQRFAELLPWKRKNAFRSGRHAQEWLESLWSIGFIALIPVGQISVVLLMHGVAYFTHHELPTQERMEFMSVPFLPLIPVVVMMMGGILAHSGAVTLGHSAFLAARPLSDSALAYAKLKAVARAIALILIIAVTFVVLYSVVAFDQPFKAWATFVEHKSSLSSFAWIGVLWLIGYYTVLWTLSSWILTLALFGSSKWKSYGLVGFAIAVVPYLLVPIAQMSDDSRLFILAIRGLSTLLLTAVIVFIGWTARESFRRRLVYHRVFVKAVAVWGLVTLIAVPVLWLMRILPGPWLLTRAWPELILLGGILFFVMPIAPLVIAPYAMFTRRHEA